MLSKNKPRGAVQLLTIIFVVLMGFAISGSAYYFTLKHYQDEAHEQFRDLAIHRVMAIENSIKRHLQIVRSIAGLYSATNRVARSDFHAFVQQSLDRYPGIKALEWIPRITEAQRKSFEAAAHRDGYTNFQITERSPQNRLVAAQNRREYFPVYFIEPMKGNAAALGFDLASNAARKAALIEARDSGRMVSTKRIRLIQETGNQSGFLTFLPIYSSDTSAGSIPVSLAQRRIDLIGFALGVFRVGDLIEKALVESTIPAEIDIYLIDEDATGSDRLLHHRPSSLRQTSSSALAEAELRHGLYMKESFDVGGRRWSIIFKPIPGAFTAGQSFVPLGVLGIDVLLTIILAIYLMGAKRRLFTIEHQVVERTTRLSELNEVLTSEIEHRKNTEEALLIAKEQADTANNAKSDFLSSMSHELRTPLNAIMGFAQLLETDRKSPLTDIQIEYTEFIRKGGDHLLELINEVLDLVKIESGQSGLSIEPVTPLHVINECLIHARSLAVKRSIAVTEKFDFTGPSRIDVDTTRFRQVLLNLLSNAVKYNREGGSIVLSCRNASSGHLRIGITDTGYGISLDRQEELFQPFSRLGAECTEIEGTGIGLHLSKSLVELMGGRIGFETRENEGSTFWIEFPLSAEQGVSDTAKPIEATELPALSENTGSPVQSLLYVEDNPANLQLMEAIVKRLPNIDLKSAHNAELGLELALSNRPDVIIMDINLPGMDGFQALRKIRISPVLKDIPVIALSASAMKKDIDRGLKAGFAEYLTKPLNVPKLLDTLAVTLKVDL